MRLARPIAVVLLAGISVFAAPASAQTVLNLITPDTPAATSRYRLTEGDLRFPREPARAGISVTVPLRHNLDIGVGRFIVAEQARPRSNIERDWSSERPRERGIAALGVTIRF